MSTALDAVRVVSLAFVASGAFGCADSDADFDESNQSLSTDDATAPQQCRADHAPLRVLTYNTALAPGFERLTIQRAPMVIQALATAATDLDLMCVQELWNGAFFDGLRATATELPYALRMDPKPGTGGCTDAEFLPLAGCLETNCSSASGEGLVKCAQEKCTVAVAALSGGCLGCIINRVDRALNDPLGPMACLATAGQVSDPAIFGGEYDAALLSRWPIVKSEVQELSAYFVRASVLHARIDVPRYGEVDAYCTHLGSSLGIVEYAGNYGSWEGEHLQQVDEVVKFVKKTNRGRHPVVLLGDFNMGPKVGENSAVLASHYERLVRRLDLDNAYVVGHDPLCTECAGTSFRGVDATNEIIDHIFSKRLPTRQVGRERLFIEPVELGNGQTFNLSDHYGLKISFPKPH